MEWVMHEDGYLTVDPTPTTGGKWVIHELKNGQFVGGFSEDYANSPYKLTNDSTKYADTVEDMKVLLKYEIRKYVFQEEQFQKMIDKNIHTFGD